MEISLAENKTLTLFAKCRNYILPAFALIVTVFILQDYFVPRIQIALGIMAAPFVFKIKQPGIFSYRYAFIALIFLGLYYYLHISTLLFFSLGCFIFFTIECQSGKIGILPFLFLLCISPALHYLVSVFTFSIRLELSGYAALILNSIGFSVQNKGSYFVMPDGYNFSVDTACIGLNMINTGLSVSMLLIGFSEQKIKKDLNLYSLIIVFATTAFCLILTNLLRIVALVFFRSEAGTFGHNIIGIFSLIAYTIIPVYLFVNFLNKRFGRQENIFEQTVPASFKKNSLTALCLAAFFLFVNFKVNQENKYITKDQKLSQLKLPGYARTEKDDGVVEFRNDNALVYIKPANKGYESDHPPAMCWQGSGFQLGQISEVNYKNFTVFTGTLKKDSVVQYTAWWYDNGVKKTTSQLEWRFSRGEPYRIINITAKTKDELNTLCGKFLDMKLF